LDGQCKEVTKAILPINKVVRDEEKMDNYATSHCNFAISAVYNYSIIQAAEF
jgi:hypothetical protein